MPRRKFKGFAWELPNPSEFYHMRGYFPAIWRRVGQRLRYIISSDSSRSEGQMALLSLLVGIWLFAFPIMKNESYQVVRWAAPQNMWASCFVAIGVVKMVAVILGAIPLRKMCALAGLSVWGAWVIFFGKQAGFQRLGFPMYLTFALINLVSYLWLATTTAPPSSSGGQD